MVIDIAAGRHAMSRCWSIEGLVQLFAVMNIKVFDIYNDRYFQRAQTALDSILLCVLDCYDGPTAGICTCSCLEWMTEE
jgi:hypothetical protein